MGDADIFVLGFIMWIFTGLFMTSIGAVYYFAGVQEEGLKMVAFGLTLILLWVAFVGSMLLGKDENKNKFQEVSE